MTKIKENYWICKHIPGNVPETLFGFHYLKDAKEKAREFGGKSIFIVDRYWREHKY